MKITLDNQADAAYIYLVSSIPPGGVKKTLPLENFKLPGMINLDFDGNDKLIGIEIVGARNLLDIELLSQAEVIS